MKTILDEIGMPAEACERILETHTGISSEKEEELCARLCDPQGYDGAYNELKELLQTDADGFAMLQVMLRAAEISRRKYRERGISEKIFADTMGCFSRFVREYKVCFGHYGFDRGFWTGRQLSLSLFRLGTLEFETNGAVHIPSDADLSEAALDESFAKAREFFPSVRFCCDSWLLSPVLGELLPPDSRINRFRERFEIQSVDENNDGYKFWVFQNSNIRAEDFPERTSLQRAVKRHVLAGGKIGEAFGFLKNIK